MNTSQNSPIESLLHAIGASLTSRTKQADLKKQDLAALADVSQNTITSILSGGDMKVSTLIRLTRVLNCTEWLAPLVDEPAPSPLQLLNLVKRRKLSTNLPEKPAARPMGRNMEAGK